MKKRGQLEIQFNWIFVLIVGALILILVISIILKQKDISEQNTNILISRNFEAIFTGAEVSTGTVNILDDIPKTKIDFGCNEYSIGSASKNFQIMSVFAPSSIDHDKIITWTLDWSLPYRVTNFLYLTSPDVRYILVGTTPLANRINEALPKEMNKELVDTLSEAVYKNDKKVRFIIFDPQVQVNLPTDFYKIGKNDLSALRIDESENKITFFQKKTNRLIETGNSYYLLEPSLIGAIFTDSSEIYDCAMENAYKKLKIITEIYQ